MLNCCQLILHSGALIHTSSNILNTNPDADTHEVMRMSPARLLQRRLQAGTNKLSGRRCSSWQIFLLTLIAPGARRCMVWAPAPGLYCHPCSCIQALSIQLEAGRGRQPDSSTANPPPLPLPYLPAEPVCVLGLPHPRSQNCWQERRMHCAH